MCVCGYVRTHIWRYTCGLCASMRVCACACMLALECAQKGAILPGGQIDRRENTRGYARVKPNQNCPTAPKPPFLTLSVSRTQTTSSASTLSPTAVCGCKKRLASELRFPSKPYDMSMQTQAPFQNLVRMSTAYSILSSFQSGPMRTGACAGVRAHA